MYRVVSSYAAPPVIIIIPGALAILTQDRHRVHVRYSRAVLGNRRRRRLVPEMRFERSLRCGLLREVSKVGRGLSLLVGILAARFRCLDNNPV
jgi:hypothetical protein